MNNKGFTLVELLATLVILGIVVGITFAATNFNIGGAKEKAEKVYVKTLTDALAMYLDSDARKLTFSSSAAGTTSKKQRNLDAYKDVKIYKNTGTVKFRNVIDSEYSPLDISDLINPNNEDVACNANATVSIYRDEDYVYYYLMKKSDFSCLLVDLDDEYITNLPCDFLKSKIDSTPGGRCA